MRAWNGLEGPKTSRSVCFFCKLFGGSGTCRVWESPEGSGSVCEVLEGQVESGVSRRVWEGPDIHGGSGRVLASLKDLKWSKMVWKGWEGSKGANSSGRVLKSLKGPEESGRVLEDLVGCGGSGGSGRGRERKFWRGMDGPEGSVVRRV